MVNFVEKGHFLVSAALDIRDLPALIEVSSCKMHSGEGTFLAAHNTIKPYTFY